MDFGGMDMNAIMNNPMAQQVMQAMMRDPELMRLVQTRPDVWRTLTFARTHAHTRTHSVLC